MKLKKVFAVLFALVALAAVGFAVYLSFSSVDAEPVMLQPPVEARQKAIELMEAVCAADYEKASACIWSSPSLGVDRDSESEVGRLFWDAFEKSLSYELVGDLVASDAGMTQQVKLTGLDISSVTANLKERTQKLMEQRVEEKENTAEIYDEEYNYREEFIMGTLYDAAVAALEEDRKDKTVELTLNLAYVDGQWWVIADEALFGAISGGVLY